jgi:chromosomal replication initiation ATPase DnaA
VTDADLIAQAANSWGVPVDQIVGPDVGRPCRIPKAVEARQAVAYVLRTHRRRSTREIARTLNISHTTVIRVSPDLADPNVRDLEWAAMQGDTDE